jgi:hypothetical protein
MSPAAGEAQQGYQVRRRGYAGHFSWTGFYLGRNIGGAWAHRDVTDTFCPGASGRETGRAPA